MPTGTVKAYDPERGIGHLLPDDGGQEVAVESGALNVSDALERGQRVSYELLREPGAELRAINVVPLRVDGGHDADLL